MQNFSFQLYRRSTGAGNYPAPCVLLMNRGNMAVSSSRDELLRKDFCGVAGMNLCPAKSRIAER